MPAAWFYLSSVFIVVMLSALVMRRDRRQRRQRMAIQHKKNFAKAMHRYEAMLDMATALIEHGVADSEQRMLRIREFVAANPPPQE